MTCGTFAGDMCMAEAEAALREVYDEAGLEECPVVQGEVEGRTVLVCTEGSKCGCVYSVGINATTGMQDYYGRLREDGSLDAEAPERRGLECGEADGGEGQPAWAKEGEVWTRAPTLFQKVKVDGVSYMQRVGTKRVYERKGENRFVGMMRDDGTIEYGVDDEDITPPGVTPNMVPGKRAFVVGVLNGSYEAALERNWKVDDEDWQDLHNYGVHSVDYTAEIECMGFPGGDNWNEFVAQKRAEGGGFDLEEGEEEDGGDDGERRKKKMKKGPRKRTVEEQVRRPPALAATPGERQSGTADVFKCCTRLSAAHGCMLWVLAFVCV